LNFTIVIPTYNEAENISKLIPILLDLPISGLNVLVVDDNSSDGTGEIVENFSRSQNGRVNLLHRAGKLGMGTAYIAGFILALERGADAIGQMDADFSHPPEKWPELVKAHETCDVVIGSRYVPGGGVDVNWPIWRKFLSRFGNTYARTILGLPINDLTGGFRLFRRNVLMTMPLDRINSNGYIFQVETAYVAHRLGFTFTEVPFYFPDRQWGQSKMSLAIQREAAIRVWELLFIYRDLKRVK
jgi:dolichol-phosphate mannosyltransferase